MRVSLGTAIKLGLEEGNLSHESKTAYLLIGSNCKFHCSYCGINSNQIARVRWLEHSTQKVLGKLKRSNFRKVCLQLASNGVNEALELLEEISLPRSICLRTLDLDLVKTFFSKGSDTVGIPLDAVSPEISEQVQRGEWVETLELLREVAKLFPRKIWTHLLIGLGEKEKETIELMQQLHAWGIGIALFAFTPVKGTKLENWKRPAINSYRRIQIARWLIEYNLQSRFKFNSRGELIQFINPPKEAFLTCGCEDCDRLYYDSSPTNPYNFPEINEEQYKKAIEEARTWQGKAIRKASKLIRVWVEYGDVIKKIMITGDFFLYPEEKLGKIEKALVGVPLEKEIIKEKIDKVLADAKTFGFSSKDLTQAIMEAIGWKK
jgi:biotin synthase